MGETTFQYIKLNTLLMDHEQKLEPAENASAAVNINQEIIGILGGGQLGRMLVEAANRLDLKTIILDSEQCPAKQVSNQPGINGSFKNQKDIVLLAEKVSIITSEIEHVDCNALIHVQNNFHEIKIHPDPETLQIIQDKFQQKKHIESMSMSIKEIITISPFKNVVGNNVKEMETSIREISKEFGFPLMLKSKTLAYDGKGNKVICNDSEILDSIQVLGNGSIGLYVEKWVKFKKELAVMVAKSVTGEIAAYPCVETIQENNICHTVIVPAQINGLIAAKAVALAKSAVSCFSGCGIYGVEMFLLNDDTITLNEIAPRPHNSGHYTIEATHTSQYEQHLRCITGMPLGSTALKVPAAAMINIIGISDSHDETFAICKKALAIPGATIHLYGKKKVCSGRKMGHITIVGDSAQTVQSFVCRLTNEPDWQNNIAPLVGIIMGSDSDLATVKPAAEILATFKVPFEVTIVSAHRTPGRMVEYARTARERGLKVVIAAAGGAAHLPGMVAALTCLPVIGIPVALKVLDGVDSLHSIVQMPRGVPVATVAINNAVNAGLLAARILGVRDPGMLDKIEKYAEQQRQVVMEKVSKLDEAGWENY